MANFEKQQNLLGAFVFDESKLRRLLDLISECLGKKNTKEIEVFFEDKLSYKTNKIDELFSEDNRSGKKIKKIRLNGEMGTWSSPNYKEIEITLGDDYFFRNIGISVSGSNRDWVYISVQKFFENIQGSREWYSFLVFIFREPWDFLISTVLIFIVWFFPFFYFIIDLVPKNLIFILGFLDFAICFLVIKVINKFLQWLFPLLVFNIGLQIEASKRINNIRRFIFSTIILSSIIVPLFWFLLPLIFNIGK